MRERITFLENKKQGKDEKEEREREGKGLKREGNKIEGMNEEEWERKNRKQHRGKKMKERN